jgi:hypothetical protein
MKTQDPHHDDRTRKLFAALGVEEPSADFTSSLMQQVYAEAARSQLGYEPLISRRVILFILIGLLLLLGAVGYYAWQTGGGADPEAAPVEGVFALLNQSTDWVMGSLPLLQDIFHLALGLVVFWLLLLADKLLAGAGRQQAI